MILSAPSRSCVGSAQNAAIAVECRYQAFDDVLALHHDSSNWDPTLPSPPPPTLTPPAAYSSLPFTKSQ